MTKKMLCGLLSVTVAVSILSGCTGEKKAKKANNEETLTYWVRIDPNLSSTTTTLGESEYGKTLMERTGVRVNYIHPPVSQEKEQFNLMIASKELPDIVECNWSEFPGGPEKAINDGYIINLNDIMEKDSPNLKNFLEANPQYKSDLKTDSGQYFCYPFIRGDDSLLTAAGIALRGDWLEELKLDIPETIDEWYNVLKAFKEKKNATAPLSFTLSNVLDWGLFSGAYGATKSFYVDGDVVKFGGTEPGFLEFLKTFNKWYNEGLIDRSFMTNDSTTLDSKILNGNCGATPLTIGGGIGRISAAAKGKVDGFKLVPAKYPTLKKGERPKFGQVSLSINGIGAAITTKCKSYETAAKLLDYGYGEEGHILNNFGIEGKSFKMVDGYPTYTDEIMNNPDGLSITAAMAKYLKAYESGPFVQDKRYMEQYAQLPEQKEALKIWPDTDAIEHAMPLVYVLQDETSELATITTDITTYQDEMIAKFIMGVESIEKFEEYVKTIESLGLQRALEIKQSALERFNNR